MLTSDKGPEKTPRPEGTCAMRFIQRLTNGKSTVLLLRCIETFGCGLSAMRIVKGRGHE